MSGIAGFLALRGQRADCALLERMVTPLHHRGPDAVGLHVEGAIALGIARLRMGDLDAGALPLGNEDGSVQVIADGEIYNDLELRRRLTTLGHRFRTASHTETIVHAWEEYGEHALDHLNGTFALALWDARREQLVLARDRMGEKPLFWAEADGWLVFGSELRALLAHPAVTRELDPRSVARYLAFNYVPDPRTILRNVRKLRPAHVLLASGGKRAVHSYWDLPYRPEPEVNEARWSDQILARLDEAVRRRLVTDDGPLGCFVGGGIDSTAIAASAVRECPGLRTFSVGYAEARDDERSYARLVAERYGTEHRELVVTATDVEELLPRLGGLLDEPLADVGFVPLYLLARAAKPFATVALTGHGGDELFGGYPTMGAAWWQSVFVRMPRWLVQAMEQGAEATRLVPGTVTDFLHSLRYRPDARNQALLGSVPPVRQARLLSPSFRRILAGFDPYVDIEDVLRACPTREPCARLLYQYAKLYLAGQNLVTTDRASMAAGLGLRSPFLDHTFVEFVGRIPANLRLQGLLGLKSLLKRAVATRLPGEILGRGKHRSSVPLAAWLRGSLAKPLLALLARDRVAAGGIFDPATVTRLVEEHVAGRRSHTQVLWSLVVFETWRGHYLGDRSPLV